ncbi:helix-hairpin-helix domain-containing protein [Carboxydothermus hydrogenoformans]|uniref:Competence protein n=1 Tax=Carboxydothermus hydrogenoformans (strain ATCC BAA-161 / DSM 6008 / Z-2901) TaxID=246194 RepID=Q3AF21_CARHZ|nr:helix-hairpin-helix domain-containing protein [Carboxydothermus hydrogenoformans]ABB15935.1 competence protein [Carboxydothermus hydrogenoformans Z-2901]
MNPFDDRSKLSLYGIIFLLLALVCYLWWTGPESPPLKETAEQEVITREVTPKGTVVVHVAGAVYKPGVYVLEEGARVKDAIEKARGMLPLADDSSINLAAKVSDGQKIYIPFKNETTTASASTNKAFGQQNALKGSGGQEAKVNINTATAEELDELPGVGPATAAKIIEYREQNGPFATIEDLKKVKGIGDKKFETLKDYITVN